MRLNRHRRTFFALSLGAIAFAALITSACNFGSDPTPTAVSVAPAEIGATTILAEPDTDAAVLSVGREIEAVDEVSKVSGRVEDTAVGSDEPERQQVVDVPPLPSVDYPDAVPDDVGIIWEAFQFINDDYVEYEKVDAAAMSEAAIRAFIESLGDPHMTYISPEHMELNRADLAGSFEGIGATVQASPDGKGVLIQAPLPDSPAIKAGIRPGDRILAVDGADATTWTVTEAVLKIRGIRGEPVVLTVLHVGDEEPVDITIIRDRVPLPSITSRMIPETDYGELNIDQFTDETPREIREHMDEMIDQGAKGVVIDLRNNPGGLLNATLDSASEFIAEGRLAYEQDRDGARRDFYAHGNGNFTTIPIVVLINDYSGSGAELFAGAMQDHGRAVLIGETTFGKGSVNATRRLSNGGGLSITIRRWYTPNGNAIEGVGLNPDVEVEYPEVVNERDVNFEDPQLSAAIKQLDFQTRVTTLRQ